MTTTTNEWSSSWSDTPVTSSVVPVASLLALLLARLRRPITAKSATPTCAPTRVALVWRPSSTEGNFASRTGGNEQYRGASLAWLLKRFGLLEMETLIIKRNQRFLVQICSVWQSIMSTVRSCWQCVTYGNLDTICTLGCFSTYCVYSFSCLLPINLANKLTIKEMPKYYLSKAKKNR